MTQSPISVRQAFFSWIDEALTHPFPGTTVAFHFNLYEGEDSVHVQLIGTETFVPGEDPSRDYWPGKETFSTGEAIFEVPFVVAGVNWREWLKTLKDMVNLYIVSGAASSVLRNSKGVGIGFVDGDMYVLWQSDAS